MFIYEYVTDICRYGLYHQLNKLLDLKKCSIQHQPFTAATSINTRSNNRSIFFSTPMAAERNIFAVSLNLIPFSTLFHFVKKICHKKPKTLKQNKICSTHSARSDDACSPVSSRTMVAQTPLNISLIRISMLFNHPPPLTPPRIQ